MKYQMKCLRNEIDGITENNVKHNNSPRIVHGQFQNIVGKIDQILAGKIVYQKPNYWAQPKRKIKWRIGLWLHYRHYCILLLVHFLCNFGMIDISGHRKGNTMTKEYVFGLIWLPIAIGLLVIFPNWWTFSILLIGILIFLGGELQEKETYNYRLSGYERHRYTIPATDFHNGFLTSFGILFVVFILFQVYRWSYRLN